MTADERDLESLQFHWGSAYVIWRGIGGTWCARNRDFPRADPLVAYSDDDLRLLIRADYDRRTVNRRVTGEPARPTPRQT